MRVRELLWSQDRINHIARHNVQPDEVEEVFFGKPFVRSARSQGENPVYYVYGQTNTGSYCFV